MTSRWTRVLGAARDTYRSSGVRALARGAFRYSRQRLPVTLWPELLLDPMGAADETVRLHDTASFELRYEGRHGESLPRQLAAAEGRILGADGSMYVYRDAEVVGRRPVVGVDGRYFPPSWLGVDTAYFIHQKKYLKRNLPLTHRLRAGSDTGSERDVETGFLLLGERSLEFPAWHHEVLPKLRWLEEYEQLTGESPTLIVSADLGEFHERSLELMGYDPDAWVDTSDGPVTVRRLLVAPHPRRAKGTHLHTTDLAWVGDRIRSNLPAPTTGFADRVYVSRADADRRRVRNEREVVAALQEEGFESYEPGRLSYAEEVQLFAGADVVVGAHGKGLASVFHASDAALLELFPERGATEHYFCTARERGFDYEFLTCDPVDGDENRRARDRDIVVDVETLRDRVDPLLAQEAKPVG